MSEELRRVILQHALMLSESNTENRRLKDELLVITQHRHQQRLKFERFCESVFSLLNHPTNTTFTLDVKTQLANFGYCLTCEQAPCECEGQYD